MAGPEHPAADVPIPGEGPITSPDQVDPQLTPASVGLPDDPVASGSSQISEPRPEPAAHPAADIPTPAEVGHVKAKVDVSTKGITEHGKRQAGGLFDQADARIKQLSAADLADTKNLQARADAHYGTLRAATGEEYDATKAYEAKNQELQQKIADFNAHAANTEERINQEAVASRQAYMTDYKTQLAGVRQLAMQSGNPMATMSAPQSIGLMGAQFAQGFLAARGINIDVAGQVDRWVDRSIQEHQAKISNMRQAAGDSLHLYDLARQASADDAEGRARYRGFVVAGLQMGVQMNAARFQSDIGMAHAHEAIAKLQIEADTTERSIGDAHQARVHAIMTSEYDRAYKTGQLAIESARFSAEKAHWDAEDRRANKPQKGSGIVWINDPTVTLKDAKGKPASGGKVIAYIDPDAPAAIQTQAAEQYNKASQFYGDLRKAVAQVNALRPPKMTGVGFYDNNSPEYRQFASARDLAVAQVQQAMTGMAATKEEHKTYVAPFQDDKFWQSGSNKNLTAGLLKWGRDRYNTVLEGTAGIKAVPKGVVPPGYESSGGYEPEVHGDPKGDAEWDAISSKEKPRAQLDERVSSQYATMPKATPGVFSDPNVKGGVNGLIDSVNERVSDSVSGKVLDQSSLRNDDNLIPPSKAFSILMGLQPGEKQPHNAVGVEILARAYLDPSHAREAFKHDKSLSMPDDDDTLQHQMLSGLERLTSDRDPFVANYAQIVEDKLKSDPAGLRQLLLAGNHTAPIDAKE